jgi:ATP-dependent protease ClpP protease subunit
MDIKQQDILDKKTIIGKPLSTIYEFYLVGDIESPEHYTEWYDTIRNIGPHDVVRLYINSVGGDLFTSIQFRNVIKQCQGTVMIEVEGACMSAATMIMLASDNIDISDNSMFMFHNYSGGVIGKGGEMYDNIMHERQWSEQLLRDVYTDFLEEDEIQQILDNRDIWMDSDEVIKRLISRAELKKDEESS